MREYMVRLKSRLGLRSVLRTRTDIGNVPDALVRGIALEGVQKAFGGIAAVDNVTLSIGEGEFFTLLGSSGCGKTTTLRMIAGLERPDQGAVFINGRDMTRTPANRRPVNMVFQDYALFPHLTVAGNIEFGLRLRGVARHDRRTRVDELLGIVDLEGLGSRRPQQLSGGQRQRVALARALANDPSALLLDEPLGALDVKLRKALQDELKAVQRRTGKTFVYVTHDQDEALAMSDRIGIMHRGVLEQVGTPSEIYYSPNSRFVAEFVGSLNVLEIAISKSNRDVVIGSVGGEGQIEVKVRDGAPRVGQTLVVGVRPEDVAVVKAPSGSARSSSLPGVVQKMTFLGMTTRVDVLTRGGLVAASDLSTRGNESLDEGDSVYLEWPSDKSFGFDDARPEVNRDSDLLRRRRDSVSARSPVANSIDQGGR